MNSPCVEWSGACNSKGYGYISVKRRAVRATRALWEKANGKIPQGIQVLHRCDNPKCINLDHLFLGTNRDNAIDMVKKGRCHLARLTVADVIEIRERRKSDEPIKEIAERFDISAHYVRRICNRERWAHVP